MIRKPLAVLVQCMIAASAFGFPSALSFSYSVPDAPVEAVLQSVHDGHRAEIVFQVRLYRPSSGLGRLLGDRLVAEREIVYTARWDALNLRYVVQAGERQEITFNEATAFTSFFFTVSSYLEISAVPDESWYVICRARIEPIRLVPPLTLLFFVDRRFRYFTAWEQVQFAVYRL